MQQEECSFTPTLCPKSVVLTKGRRRGADTQQAQRRRQEAEAKMMGSRDDADGDDEHLTFTPDIRVHKTHRKRPDPQTRIAQMLNDREKHLAKMARQRDELARQQAKAVPRVNKARPASPQRQVKRAQGSCHGNSGGQPVHERLYDRRTPRSALSERGRDHSHCTVPSNSNDATSPTKAVPYDRMERDIAARRLREAERQGAIDDALRDHATAPHTLKHSNGLNRARLERRLRSKFDQADREGNGALRADELEVALRLLNVLHHNPPKQAAPYKNEASVLATLARVFELGDGMLGYEAYERLMLQVLQGRSSSPSGNHGGGGREASGRVLELLPPDVYDSLVTELGALHRVNKHACATGSGPRKSCSAAVLSETEKDITFAPQINAKSRQLERQSPSTDSPQSASPAQADRPGSDGRCEQLYQAGVASLQRKDEMALVAQEERLEAEGCTFWPVLSGSPPRPHGTSFGLECARKSRAELLATEQSSAAKREALELAEATFYPMTNTRSHAPVSPADESFQAAQETPRGFESAVARMRSKAKAEAEATQAVLEEAESDGLVATPAKGPSLLSRKLPTPRKALLNMEVNVGGGKKGLIVLREGDEPAAVAASFARVWQLDAATESLLARKVDQLTRG